MKIKSLKTVALALSIPMGLSSCSKQSDPVNTLELTEAFPGVKVSSTGRLVFTDNDSYNTIAKSLAAMNSQELDSWEKQLGFHSLRTLDAKKLPTSFDLKYKFGFPVQYAAIISPNGEYQIGERISWFHEGFRYIAKSENELAAIKNDVSLATEKYAVGLQYPKNSTAANLRTVRIWNNQGTDQTGGDGKYNQDSKSFLLDGDRNSRRKINFESAMFVENVTDRVGHQDGYNVYYTEIHLNEYYESQISNSTYIRDSDYPRVTSASLSGTYSLQGSNFYTQSNRQSLYTYTYSGKGQALTGNINININNVSHNNGDYPTPIAGFYIYSYHSEGDSGFTWIYNITGSYSSYLSSTRYPNGAGMGHSEDSYSTGQPLW